MELNKETVYLCGTVAKGTTQAMADGDVNVPDVKPDILKVLQVDAAAYITDKYIENGRLVISGRVEYKVMYVPDKENERIKSILTSMDFRQTADGGGADADAAVIAAADTERVEFNLLNSRKLRLRAIIRIDYEICRTEPRELCIGVEDESAECLREHVEYENAVNISEHTFTIKELIEVPSGQSSIAEILKTDVKISDTEHKAVTGKLIVKGIAGVNILYTDDDNEVKFIEAELPFTEVLDADAVHEETVCDIDYKTAGVMCEAERDSDGDMRIAAVDIDITAAVRGTEPAETDAVTDCFVPYRKTECERESVKLRRIKARPSAQYTIRETAELPANAPAVGGVYNVMTDARITKSELQRGRILCEGKVEAYVLYITESPESPIYSIRKDIPFSYMLDCDGADGSEEVSVKCAVKHISYNLGASGEPELRCLLAIDCTVSEERELMNITDISCAEMSERHGIVICFTHEGDSLWDIAKHYGIPKSRIAKYNKLDGEVLTEARLFIPT